MSIPLDQALQNVDLEAGRTYPCHVKGRTVQVKVWETPPELLPDPLNENDIMLEPWVEFPDPEPLMLSTSYLTEPEPPDIPEIPGDEES